MSETIDDRLKRLNAELDKLLNKTSEEPENNLQRLIRFGLSEDEAQAWLQSEPNYSRRKVTPFKTDEEEPEPFSALYKGGIVFSELLVALTSWMLKENGKTKNR